MSATERRLPLFPLNVVLFPNASIPLQIFEERYKQMIQDCLDSDSKFGVALIKAGSEVGGPAIPHTTGTMAHIVQVNRVDGGRMFISIIGQQRFQIKNITQYRPYMAAQVELMEESEDADVPPTEMEAIRKAANEHVRLTLGMRGGWIRESRLPSDPTTLSYFIAGMLQAQLPDKQALLEESTTSKRLESELDLLRRENEVLKRQVSRELRGKFGRQ
ncbi:MAG: LON peptidase substrate-binding domain-containing protein [Chloroflexi bacterium]|nr:LON peptidase substrate-binding domain-containing protein [Chloroflexota bacterium]